MPCSSATEQRLHDRLSGTHTPGLHGLLEGSWCVRSSPVGRVVANVAINNGRSDPNGNSPPGTAGAEHHHRRDTLREALSQRSGGRRQEDSSGSPAAGR
jgi:hypothetical protein